MQLHRNISIPDDEIVFSAVRSPGSGGQNVNKVSTAVELRLDLRASSLPEGIVARLLSYSDHRISSAGVIVIKAHSHRSQRLNRREALDRLKMLFAAALHTPKVRRATRPGKAAVERRLKAKRRRADIKSSRRDRNWD